MAGLPLSPPVFAILSALVEERFGLHYAPSDRELFGEKVSARAVDAGFESLLDYYYFLRYDPGGERELEALLEALVVNETYFFREFEQLKLVPELVAPAVEEGRRPRIWCAASATGEEPLTLAMLLAERRLLDAVELVASDISERALERAQAGEFTGRSLRHLPRPELSDRWLERTPRGYRASGQLVRAIQWRRINLARRQEVEAVGPCDIILCRNVLIYFREELVRQVVASLGDRLVPNGTLFVGVSESLLRFGTSLNCEEHGGVFVYRKAA